MKFCIDDFATFIVFIPLHLLSSNLFILSQPVISILFKNSAPFITTFLILHPVNLTLLRTLFSGNTNPVNLVYERSIVFKFLQFEISNVCDSVAVPNKYELAQLRCLKYLLSPTLSEDIRLE